MGIGPVSGMSASPYIYNVNKVSANSLNKVKGIGEDVASEKTDFTGLVDESAKNVNPLKKGETADFEGLVQMQMASAQSKAAMIFG